MNKCLGNLDYFCQAFESSQGNLVISMTRKVEGLPFNTEYHITRDMLDLSDQDFCMVNKLLDHVLTEISYSLHEYIKAKLAIK